MSPTLPIHAARADLEAALAVGGPIVVTAPTGSGKSTCLPGWIAAAKGAPVLVVEPRRVACRSLALYLAREAGEAVGETFGYRVRFDERVSARTKVCFVTPGMALNLVAAGRLDDYAALMLDEFHERSWELDLLVALARGSRGDLGRGPQLIVCSATLAMAQLVETLDAAAVVAEGRSFPVTLEYVGEDAPSEVGLEGRVAEAVEAALEGGLADGEAAGDVLVFLPGKGEIRRCAAALRQREEVIVAVHGGVAPDRLVDAFAPTRARRVFLATNVAESSLTLPGVRTVIDTGLARMRTHQGGRSILALSIIARDSMDQRAGRAGRVAPGRCVRLWSSAFVPREVTAPELERIELDDLILRAAGCGLDPGALEDAPWLDPPPAFALAAARARLAAVGALDGTGRLSSQGRRLARLPVAGERGRMLLEPPPALAGTLADLVALLEHGRSLWLPGDGRADGGAAVDEARAALLAELPRGCRDEVHAGVLVVRRGQARRHGLHGPGLAEVRRLAKALRDQIGAPSPTPAEELPGPGELVRYLLTRIPEAAFVRRPRARSSASPRGHGHGHGHGRRDDDAPWANGEVELSVRAVELPGLERDDQDPAPVAGLVLDHEWLGVGRRARGRGGMVLACSLAQLAAAGLGETELGEPELERRGGAVTRLVAPVVRRLAGVELGRQTQALAGADLRGVLATMILAGRRLPPLSAGLGERVRAGLHLWSLAHQAVTGPLAGRLVHELPPPPEAQPWLRDRLEGLGLEALDELALVSDDDLCPELCALAPLGLSLAALGERDWTLTALAEDFPYTWSERDARYRCRVNLERRRVVLEPLDALARKRGEPKADLVPRFRGFAVVFQQASRRVELR